MTESNATDTTATAPAPAAKASASALSVFLESVAGQKTNATDKAKIGAAFKAFIAKKEKIEEQLKALEVEELAITKAMLTVHGRTRAVINGREYVPSSRGEKIFYKSMSSGDVVEL